MNQSFVPETSERLAAALRRFDQENSQDPNFHVVDGARLPRELVYARWLGQWVLKLEPGASEVLRLAAHGAHLRRWEIPRSAYPATRAGYLRWRQELKEFHAQKAADILRNLGYADTVIARVEGLISKRAFPNDPESRVLEDALCLLFLEHQFAELAAKSADDKMINAVQKTWKKMSTKAQEIARGLPYGARERDLLTRALSGESASES